MRIGTAGVDNAVMAGSGTSKRNAASRPDAPRSDVSTREDMFAQLPVRRKRTSVAMADFSRSEQSVRGKRSRADEAQMPWRWANLPQASESAADGRAAQAQASFPASPPGAEAAGASSLTPARGVGRATAQMVHTILSKRANGMGLTDFLRAYPSFPKGTVTSWLNRQKWQYRNFPDRLAKLPDYAVYRERLDALARSLGMTTRELPPPAQGPKEMDAHALKAALELIAEEDERRARGAGGTSGFLATVARRAGDYAMSTIANWLSVKGIVKKPAGAIARLEGYDEVREDLRGLLVRLGQPALAAKLPVAARASVRSVTTAMLVDALRIMASNPNAKRWEVGLAIGLDATCLALHFVPADGSLANPAAVQRLPDYADEREALASALEALGHAEQAEALPLPLVDAMVFLQTLSGDRARVAAAVQALRSNCDLSPRAAANEAGIPPAVLTAICDDHGRLHTRGAVFALLDRLPDYLESGIADQLGRLRDALSGGPLQGGAPSAMKRVQFNGSGTIPGKVFVVPEHNNDPGARTRDRLAKLYAGSPELVRKPRTYASDRAKQLLRWQSTVLRTKYPDSMEVQSYYSECHKAVFVSTNVNTTNARLKAALERQDLNAIADSLDEAGNETSKERANEKGGGEQEVQLGEREARHLKKLRAALRIGPAGVPHGVAADALTAILSRDVRVAESKFTSRGKTVSLHAERRIKHEVGTKLTPHLLGGTMRPCGTCADDIGVDEDARRGPFWLSRNAKARIDADGVIERNVERGIATYVTETRGGSVTVNHDTDSDSDAEAAEKRMKLMARENAASAGAFARGGQGTRKQRTNR